MQSQGVDSCVFGSGASELSSASSVCAQVIRGTFKDLPLLSGR